MKNAKRKADKRRKLREKRDGGSELGDADGAALKKVGVPPDGLSSPSKGKNNKNKSKKKKRIENLIQKIIIKYVS